MATISFSNLTTSGFALNLHFGLKTVSAGRGRGRRTTARVTAGHRRVVGHRLTFELKEKSSLVSAWKNFGAADFQKVLYFLLL